MPTNKNNSSESVRKLWTKQRKGENPSVAPAKTGHGSHFAASVPSASGEGAQPSASAPASHRHAHLKITGASGEMPKVPVRIHKADVDSYSRYNMRYTGASDGESGAQARSTGFTTTPQKGQPAYAWKPFVLYAGVCAIAALLWVIGAKLVNPAPIVAGEPLFTLGIALLCCIVLGGLAMVVVATSLTKKTDPALMTTDVAASALGKGSVAMLVSVAVWIAAAAVLTLVVL